LWQTLDIPADSERFRYIAWLRESGADLMFAGDGKIIGFDGVFALAHGDNSINWNDWDSLSPEQTRGAVNVLDWFRRATEARSFGQPAPPGPATGGIVNSAFQLESQHEGGPMVNLLTREQSVLWFFKTRGGANGVLQIMEFDTPNRVKIRYKLVATKYGATDPAHDTLIETTVPPDKIEEYRRFLAELAVFNTRKADLSLKYKEEHPLVKELISAMVRLEDDKARLEREFPMLKQLDHLPASTEERLFWDALAARLDAALTISDNIERDAAMAKLARGAADAGAVEVVKSALREIRSVTERDQAAFDSARRLSKLGLRKQAVDIAKTISSNTMRDMALSELAQ
jgi:hypothetical protein